MGNGSMVGLVVGIRLSLTRSGGNTRRLAWQRRVERLQAQMQAQGLVDVEHDRVRDDAQPVTHPLNGDRSNLLSLCLGVPTEPGFGALGEGPRRLFVGRSPTAPPPTKARTGDWAAVNGVGTVPGFRGRGYGSAATVAGMEGRDQGVDLAVLHASGLGEPVYRRLGFEPVCEISQWLRSVPDPI